MTFDGGYAWQVLPDLLRASVVNVEAACAGFVLALLGGLALALARMSRVSALSRLASALIEFVRDTPFLIQLYFIFYVLPTVHIAFDPLATGIIALGIHFSTYTAEVYRAGIESVPRGQWEAALALNLSTPVTWWRIVLPQAIPPVVPALGNYLIGMFKDTAILATISVNELLGTALAQASFTFRFLEPIALVALIFLAMSLAGSGLVRISEAKLRAQ